MEETGLYQVQRGGRIDGSLPRWAKGASSLQAGLLERDETRSSRVMMVYDQATFHRLPVGVGGSLRVRERKLLINRAGGPVCGWCEVGMSDDKNVLSKQRVVQCSFLRSWSCVTRAKTTTLPDS